MENFELLRRDWKDFKSGSGAGSAEPVMLILERNESEGVHYLSPPGKPDIRLSARDILNAVGEDYFYSRMNFTLPLTVISHEWPKYWIGPLKPETPFDDVYVTDSTCSLSRVASDSSWFVASQNGLFGNLNAADSDQPLLEPAS